MSLDDCCEPKKEKKKKKHRSQKILESKYK